MSNRIIPLRKVSSAGTVVAITPEMIETAARGGGAPTTSITGTGWMSPGKAPVIAIQPEQDSRRFDFPVGINTRFQPKSGEGVTFGKLRALADAYDLLRVIIERRKDQVEAFEWEVIPNKGLDPAGLQEQIKTATDFFRNPSSDYDWGQWLRAALEDLLVCDAIAVAPRMTYGGDLYSLDLVDVATIKKVIDDRGMTPVPPEMAYQQIIKGIPAVPFTTQELYYWMRNPRTWKIYGFSPVEWIIITVNIALQRQAFTMSYFSEGNIPEALASVPEGWTTQQIKDFQMYWDDLMMGQVANRRRMRWIPSDATKIKELKQPDHKNEFEEWLARLVCFAFSVSPSALIKDMNRATADTNREIANDEGLMPTLSFLKNRMNFILRKTMGFTDLQFEWKMGGALDAVQQATVHTQYLTAKVLTPDEVREDLGRQKMTPEEREAAWPTPVMIPGQDPFGEPQVDDEGKPVPGKKPVAVPGKTAPAAKEEVDDEGKPLKGLTLNLTVNVPEREVNVGDVNVTAQMPGAGE